MSETNTLYITVRGAGLAEVDGLFVPSTAPPQVSESGVASAPGFWNGRPAWDRADGRGERSPALSYSNTYQSWRIARLDGHLAYDFTTDAPLPPQSGWHVYKKGEPPAPTLTIHESDPRLAEPTVVFVLGGPGTGKGTMCELAALQLGWTHLSVGALLRASLEDGSPESLALAERLAAGHMADDGLVVRLLKAAMEDVTARTGQTHFLLDGFPRSPGNVEAWRAAFGGELPRMLYFDCPEEVLRQRVLSRAKYTGRADDNAAALSQRLQTFRERTLPTAEAFAEAGLRTDIDAGAERPAVFRAVAAALADASPDGSEKPLGERAEMLLGLRPWPKRGA